MTTTATPMVRAATETDGPAMREVVGGAGLPLEGFADSWGRWVATDATGAVVGVVALERHADADGAAYLLRSLAVDPSQRGTGVGAALVAAALAAADTREGGRAGVGLLTETAAGYFDRFGFAGTAWSGLPPALSGSAQLGGVCPASAAAYWRD